MGTRDDSGELSKRDHVISIAVTTLLRPLVRILLRRGLPYRFLAEIAKRVYVDVAREEFGIPGRKTSDSRVAILTGLTRKDLLKLRSVPVEADAELAAKYNRAARIITVWTSDQRFCDKQGKPAVLALEGGEGSFAELVRQHGADVPSRAVADELARVGAIEIHKDGKLQLLKRAYIPALGDEEKLHILGRDVSDLISTIDHNLLSAPQEAFAQRKVAYDNLPDECLPELRRLSSQQAQQLLERLDLWLSNHDRDRNPKAGGSGRNRAGVGIFYFEERLKGEDSEDE